MIPQGMISLGAQQIIPILLLSSECPFLSPIISLNQRKDRATVTPTIITHMTHSNITITTILKNQPCVPYFSQ